MKRKIVKLTESDLINIIKKVIKEQSEPSSELDTVNDILSQANLGPITQEDVPELMSDCPDDVPNDKSQQYIDKIKQAAENATLDTLKSELKKVSSASHNVQEQAVTTFIVILGITLPLIEFAIIGGAIAIILIGVILKRIFGGNYDSRSKTHCGKRKKTILPRIGFGFSN